MRVIIFHMSKKSVSNEELVFFLLPLPKTQTTTLRFYLLDCMKQAECDNYNHTDN